MRKVTFRASFSILIAVAIIIGLGIYVVRYIRHGEDWALYFDDSTSGCTYQLTDRNGVSLATMEHGGRYYSPDEGIRISCYQLIGDYAGNVGTGIIQSFEKELSGYNIITGIQENDDVILRVTVDSELNKVAYNALAGRKGAVIVSNYKTGEILCMVSSPSIDPLNPPEKLPDGVYLNRCISSSFTPGSVFKLITLTAALENIPDIYQRTFTCTGSIEVNGVTLNCSGCHGTQTIEQALANSCNCAFGELSLELGADTIQKYADLYGLTSSCTIDSIVTAAGSFTKDTAGSPGLAWSGIGQFEDLVTPYGMLRVVSAIANDGTVVEPSLLGISDKTTTLINKTTADKLADMMNYNVAFKYGTGTFPGLNISAKTGTAQVGEGKENHAWFVGFLNDDAHPYAFVVLVENGGSGLGAAGAVANTVLQAAVNNS
ncbi:MAG: penicillin-binding transpeptidase domain-containing protein [Bacillota bacterium]|nr:penicillin-binding transpeptidase domain-containing protein [Bacillota bacterium]